MTELEREYRRYLTSVARVPAGLHDRYVGWVRGFLTRPGAGESVKDASKRSVALEEYGRSIGKAEAPSTVATALNAVRHFWYFLDRRDGGRRANAAGTRHEAGDAQPGSREAGGQAAGAAPDEAQAARDALIAPVIRSARESLRLQHKTYNTEQAYLSWIDRFLRHAAPAAPADLGAEHVRRFLSWTIHYTPDDTPVERTTWSRIKSSR